jgi:hypothetical protein
MATGIYVRVPEELANRLLDDGFTSTGNKRGVADIMANAANLVTILVGSHEIAPFVQHLWAAARHQADASDSGKNAVSETKVIIERDGKRLAITLEQEGFGDGGPPETVVRGMTALLQALSEPDPREHGR